ncbi:MAG: homoserine dehydrogenase [Planctomycetaceae bacterium]|nr:homoserine dehydrogenase [Planctomycetaceae bacterium]
MEKTKIAIIGLGTVGTGVAKLLLDHGDRTARHAGRIPWLEKIIVRDLKKPRNAQIPAGVLSDNLEDIINNPEIKVVAQLIGGTEPAKTIMLQMLEAGKDVVTANKALLAEHGAELFDRARELNRCIAFEASVAGGIPIVTNIGQCLTGNQITSLKGILNGTCNYIITQMQQHGTDYQRAVKQAQQLGYAEADPKLDVDGSDTAQKLAILSHLAFGVRVHWQDIPLQGIESLQLRDIQNADRCGYRIKLLAESKLNGSAVEMNIAPTLVRKGNPLAEVEDAFNAIRVRGDAVGPVFFHGQGAGQMPTASAVVADIIDTVVGRTRLTFGNLELWSDTQSPRQMAPADAAVNKYYIRLQVNDDPGVMASLTSIIGRHGVSIASINQQQTQSDDPENTVQLVIMSHATTVGAIQAATDELKNSANIKGSPVVMRIMNS